VPNAAISGGDSKKVRHWNIQNTTASSPQDYNSTNGKKVSYVSVALDCKPQLVFGARYDGNVEVFELNDYNKHLNPFTEHGTAEVWVVEALPDGSRALSATNKGEIRLWDVAQRKTICTIDAAGDPVGGLAFRGKSQLLAAYGQGDLVLYNIDAAGQISESHTFSHGNSRAVNSVAVNVNTVVSGGFDMTARIWNLNDFTKDSITIPHKDTVWRVAISPGGKLIATACEDKGVRLFNINGSPYQINGADAVVHDRNGVMGVAFLDEGTVLYTSSEDPNTEVKVWKI
jgi:WD40 repeat protein